MKVIATMLVTGGALMFALAGTAAAAKTVNVEFQYTGNVVTFVTPQTGVYDITAFGASGGDTKFSVGGAGAEIGGDVTLTAGETLTILVGGQGGSDPTNENGAEGGGGGGSFVAGPGLNPLVVAGGGGGASVRFDGGGGISAITGDFGGGTIAGPGGGGGFSDDGQTGAFGSGLPGGASFLSIVNGVAGVDTGNHGFGGGSDGSARANLGGAGGGYSGGEGATCCKVFVMATGGGSYFADPSSLLVQTDAENFGSGLVTLSYAAVPEPAAWAMMLIGISALGAAMRSRRRGALAA